MSGTLLYALVDAPLSWGPIPILVLLLVIGSAQLWAAARRQVWLRGLPGPLALLAQWVFGALFFGTSFGVLVRETRETIACRELATSPALRTVSGPVVIEQRQHRVGNGHVRFSISGEGFTTVTSGPGCDCGFLMPMGKLFALKEAQQVEATYVDDVIVTLKRLDTPPP